jgi:hypothetical protein
MIDFSNDNLLQIKIPGQKVNLTCTKEKINYKHPFPSFGFRIKIMLVGEKLNSYLSKISSSNL